MVNYRAVERFGRRREPPSRSEIGFARARVTAGVVMGKQEAGAPVPGGIEDDVPKREIHAA